MVPIKVAYDTTPISSIFRIDDESSISKQNQIIGFFESAIMAGSLRPGALLPSTRQLSVELCVSRRTVVISYDVLAAEGFIVGRRGSGFFVSQDLPSYTFNLDSPSGKKGASNLTLIQ